MRFSRFVRKSFRGSLRSSNTAPEIITKIGTPKRRLESMKLANCQEEKLILLNRSTKGAVT